MYFSDAQILSAVGQLCRALHPGGSLIVTDNRDVERVSHFEIDASGRPERRASIHGGTDVERVLGVRESARLPA